MARRARSLAATGGLAEDARRALGGEMLNDLLQLERDARATQRRAPPPDVRTVLLSLDAARALIPSGPPVEIDAEGDRGPWLVLSVRCDLELHRQGVAEVRVRRWAWGAKAFGEVVAETEREVALTLTGSAEVARSDRDAG